MKRVFALPKSLTACLALWLAACSSVHELKPPVGSQLDQVLVPPPQVTPAMLAEVSGDFMAMSPAMEEFVKMVVPPDGEPEQRLDALFQTLRDNAAFAIEYDASATLTAAEAFRQRRANCLSFSAMFIAMARSAGLDARFQDVSVPPSWDSQDEHTLVQYRHVNVSVRLSRRSTGVIDFRVDRYSETYPKRLMSDAEALAHFHSNLSMEHLLAGRVGEAYVAAKRAIEAEDGQPFIWNNMGIIQRRLGNLDLAEASYRQAVLLDPRDWSALRNLSYVYEQRGDSEEAARLRESGELIRLRNPYYRYALAQQAYRRGLYDEALDQLDAALRRQHREPRFYYLRGLSRWQLGDMELAVDDIKKAMQVSTESGQLALYERQLEAWQQEQG